MSFCFERHHVLSLFHTEVQHCHFYIYICSEFIWILMLMLTLTVAVEISVFLTSVNASVDNSVNAATLMLGVNRLSVSINAAISLIKVLRFLNKPRNAKVNDWFAVSGSNGSTIFDQFLTFWNGSLLLRYLNNISRIRIACTLQYRWGSPWQKHPWTETPEQWPPWTETPLARDPPQRIPSDRPSWKETPCEQNHRQV